MNNIEIHQTETTTVRSGEADAMLQLPQTGFDAEMNVQFANEKSRSVKWCMLKYRCITLLAFIVVSFFQFCFIMFKEVFSEDALKEKLIQLFDKFIASQNNTNIG